MAAVINKKNLWRKTFYAGLVSILLIVLLVFLVSFSSKQSAIRASLLASLGVPPHSCTNHVLNVTQESLQTNSMGRLLRIHYQSCGHWTSALIAIPQDASPDTTVVLALHQTSNYGSQEVMGMSGDKKLSYGRHFYQAGFVVVAPDIFLAGENYDTARDWNTAGFYKETPSWSAMGRMLADHQQAITLTKHLGYGKSCIAAVGHSLGGHNALFLASLDDRVNVVISSAGFEKIKTDATPERWARDSGFIYMPKLRPFVTAPKSQDLPWDFDDVLLAIFPRSMMIVQGNADPAWTHEESVTDISETLARYYKLAGVPTRFKSYFFDGGHEFPLGAQNEAVSFMRQSCRETYTPSWLLPASTTNDPGRLIF